MGVREESAVVNSGIPDAGDRIVLICDLYGHRIAKIDHKETIKLDDKVETEKSN